MRFWKESLIIREKFLKKQFSTFLEKEMFTLATAIRPGEFADPRIAVLFKQLNTFPLHTDYGQTYLTGKGYEIIALLQDKASQVKWNKAKLSPIDIKALKNAITFMKTNYKQPLFIPDLTKLFKLNCNKLQAGIQALTGYTVHECLLNIRVQEATALLATTQ